MDLNYGVLHNLDSIGTQLNSLDDPASYSINQALSEEQIWELFSLCYCDNYMEIDSAPESTDPTLSGFASKLRALNIRWVADVIKVLLESSLNELHESDNSSIHGQFLGDNVATQAPTLTQTTANCNHSDTLYLTSMGCNTHRKPNSYTNNVIGKPGFERTSPSFDAKFVDIVDPTYHKLRIHCIVPSRLYSPSSTAMSPNFSLETLAPHYNFPGTQHMSSSLPIPSLEFRAGREAEHTSRNLTQDTQELDYLPGIGTQPPIPGNAFGLWPSTSSGIVDCLSTADISLIKISAPSSTSPLNANNYTWLYSNSAISIDKGNVYKLSSSAVDPTKKASNDAKSITSIANGSSEGLFFPGIESGSLSNQITTQKHTKPSAYSILEGAFGPFTSNISQLYALSKKIGLYRRLVLRNAHGWILSKHLAPTLCQFLSNAGLKDAPGAEAISENSYKRQRDTNTRNAAQGRNSCTLPPINACAIAQAELSLESFYFNVITHLNSLLGE